MLYGPNEQAQNTHATPFQRQAPTSSKPEESNEKDEAEFKVTDIPSVMRGKLNWPKSAQLMELWFSLPARAMNDEEKKAKSDLSLFPKRYINTTLFLWVWLERFEVVRTALMDLRRRLRNEAAKVELKVLFAEYIKKNRNKRLFPETIYNSLDPVELHSKWQFQLSEVSYKFGSVDDLYGSLGNFVIYAAVTEASIRQVRANEYEVKVKEVGLYIRDTYDFIGSQYLGHWDFGGVGLNPAGGLTNLAGWEWKLPGWHPDLGIAEAFGNEDFRQYRESTETGGDLLIFSDVSIVTAPITLQITVTP